MKESSYVVLKSLIEKKPKLFRFLSEKDIQILSQITAPPVPHPEEFTSQQILQYVHYSWFTKLLKQYGKDASFFLPCFEEDTKNKIKKTLSLIDISSELSSFTKTFLHELLFSDLLKNKEAILPLSFLPKNEISSILKFSKDQLLTIIDYLSLYDLAIEMKKIVDTKVLKKLISFLSQKQKEFLAQIQIRMNSFQYESMLFQWDLTQKSLSTLLHKRGLYYFSICLKAEHKDFLWYIVHRLDTGRGDAILKIINEQSDTSISKIIKNHILQIITTLNM